MRYLIGVRTYISHIFVNILNTANDRFDYTLSCLKLAYRRSHWHFCGHSTYLQFPNTTRIHSLLLYHAILCLIRDIRIGKLQWMRVILSMLLPNFLHIFDGIKLKVLNGPLRIQATYDALIFSLSAEDLAAIDCCKKRIIQMM